MRTGPQGPVDQLWLHDLPSLTQLSLRGLAVTIHTSAFASASPSLQYLKCDCLVLGSLSPLLSLSSLSQMYLSGSGLRSQLPANVSAVWPALQSLSCSGCNLFGALPDFRRLPALQTVSRGHADTAAHALEVVDQVLILCCALCWLFVS